MKRTNGGGVRQITPGAWLLVLAGVPVWPIQAGALAADLRPESGGATEIDEATLEIPVVELVDDPNGLIADDAVTVGGPAVPLVEDDLELLRAAALVEVARRGLVRSEASAMVPGYPPLGVGLESQRDWSSLLHATGAAEAIGADPVTLGIYPRPFPARDGSSVVLDTPAEARALYLQLFAIGGARRLALDTAAAAVAAATTTTELVAALAAYPEVTA